MNEVMYRPLNQSTNGKYEFVELYNTGDTAVDIGGYILTDSVDISNMCNDPLPASTSDNEGFVIISENTIIPANSYFVLWHNSIPGVTDQGNTFVYSNSIVANVVFLDTGDQVSILKCVTGAPVIVDSLDISLIDAGGFPSNVSLERIDVAAETNSSINWKASKTISRTGLSYQGYLPGGTPGALNTNSCPSGFSYHDGECVTGPQFLVGTYNQVSFEDPDLDTRTYSTTQTNGFRSEMEDGGAYLAFRRDLGETTLNVRKQLHDSSIQTDADDSVGLDSVDIAYVGSHGGSRGTISLYQLNQWASVTNMRLGNNARGLSLLALWACKTMAPLDPEGGTRADRWFSAFSGGLRYAVGFYEDHIRAITTDEDGGDFANLLMQGETIKFSFFNAMNDWAQSIGFTDDHEPTVAATGRTVDDCFQRLQNMTIYNMVGTERLRDNQIKAICFIDVDHSSLF